MSKNDYGRPNSLDRIGPAVKNEQRRAVLRLLGDTHEETLGIDTLAERLVNEELSTDSCCRSIRIRLRHVHLPKLAESGLVHYDAEAGDVEDATDKVDRKLLSSLESYEADG